MASALLAANRATANRDAASGDSGQFATISTSRLRSGVKLRFPIYDARNVLLLAAGAVVNAAVLDRLHKRGITTVRVHQSEVARLCEGPTRQPAPALSGYCPYESTASRQLDADIERGRLQAEAKSRPFLGDVKQHGTHAPDPEATRRIIENQQASLAQMEQLFHSLQSATPIDAGAAESISANALVQMAEDLDVFTALGIAPALDKYPARHGLQTSMLAMSIGTKLGLDKRSVMDMGIGCLVHDAGMLHIDPRIFLMESALDPVGFIEITKHPILTFDLMRNVEQLPGCSRLVAYQMHERGNGSGYPRRRKENQIHQLAKIAGVADVFVALVSPRPHRTGMLPYHAVEHLIRGAKQGLFDPGAVRGLLQTVSLFPLGSYVDLSDGRVGRVLRVTRDYTRPVVEAWYAYAMSDAPEVIDLTQSPIQIIRARAELPGELTLE